MIKVNNIYKELLQIVEDNKVKYHIYLYDFIISVDVIDTITDKDHIQLIIPGGEVTIWENSKIEKCRRPDNLIIECEHCYRIYNQYNECIGYVYC